MFDWKITTSRAALGVAVTAASLATTLNATAAPINSQDDAALFKLRYAAKAATGLKTARNPLDSAMMPLTDASATNEYTLEQVDLGGQYGTTSVTGSVGPAMDAPHLGLDPMARATVSQPAASSYGVVETVPIQGSGYGMGDADLGMVDMNAGYGTTQYQPSEIGGQYVVDNGVIAESGYSGRGYGGETGYSVSTTESYAYGAPNQNVTVGDTFISNETFVAEAYNPGALTVGSSAIGDCGYADTIVDTVPIEPYLGPIEVFEQPQIVETIVQQPQIIERETVVQTAPQTVVCPNVPVAQPSNTYVNITPAPQAAAPVFAAAPQQTQIAPAAPAFFGFSGFGGFGGGSSSSQTVIVEQGDAADVFNDNRIFDNRIFDNSVGDNSVGDNSSIVDNRIFDERVFNEDNRTTNNDNRTTNNTTNNVDKRVTNNDNRVTKNDNRTTNNDNRTTNNTTNNDNRTTNNTNNDNRVTNNIDKSRTKNVTNNNGGGASGGDVNVDVTVNGGSSSTSSSSSGGTSSTSSSSSSSGGNNGSSSSTSGGNASSSSTSSSSSGGNASSSSSSTSSSSSGGNNGSSSSSSGGNNGSSSSSSGASSSSSGGNNGSSSSSSGASSSSSSGGNGSSSSSSGASSSSSSGGMTSSGMTTSTSSSSSGASSSSSSGGMTSSGMTSSGMTSSGMTSSGMTSSTSSSSGGTGSSSGAGQVPEPAPLLLIALAGLAGFFRRKKS